MACIRSLLHLQQLNKPTPKSSLLRQPAENTAIIYHTNFKHPPLGFERAIKAIGIAWKHGNKPGFNAWCRRNTPHWVWLIFATLSREYSRRRPRLPSLTYLTTRLARLDINNQVEGSGISSCCSVGDRYRPSDTPYFRLFFKPKNASWHRRPAILPAAVPIWSRSAIIPCAIFFQTVGQNCIELNP